MSLIQVMDENCNIIDTSKNEKEIYDKTLLNNEISVVIINDKKQVLLQKRSANKKHFPNMWALCNGHIEKDENAIDGAIRELKEELGINVKEHDLIPFALIRQTNNHNVYFFYLKCNLLEHDFILQKEELSEVKWTDIDKIIKMIKNNNELVVYKENRIKIFELIKSLI